MKCKQCDAILGSHYKKCPSCGCEEFVVEKFAPQDMEEQEVKELITPFVEFTELNDFEG